MDIDEQVIPEKAENHDFYQLIEKLAHSINIDVDDLLNLPPHKEVLQFISNPSLAFVTRDISSVALKNGHIQIKLPFLSLTGSHSPLPNYYLEDMAWEEVQQEYKLTALLDLFNHRLAIYLYKIWRKYRYYICYQKDGQDQFSERMFALVGLGNSNIRELLQINQSKMLSYSGIISSSGRSPHVITALIEHCFDLKYVKIESWQFRYVSIPYQQRNSLSNRKFQIGRNFILGSKVPDYSGKFMVILSELTKEQVFKFLPTGSLHKVLHDFVSFILRDQLAWDLKLVLKEKQIKTVTLSKNSDCYLGWTSFLQSPPKNPSIILKMQI